MVIKLNAPEHLIEKAYKQALLAKGTPVTVSYYVQLEDDSCFIVTGIKGGISVRYTK